MAYDKFEILKSTAVPLPIENVDTDQIIPARFLKATDKKGFGDNVFRDWRYKKDGSVNKEFALNNPNYSGTILVAGDNFGCGSSREHAPIALKAAGVAAVIAPTFARIFYRNAFNMGLPIFELESADEIKEGQTISINLDEGTIENPDTNKTYKFTPIPPFMQELLSCGGLMNYAAKEAKNG